MSSHLSLRAPSLSVITAVAGVLCAFAASGCGTERQPRANIERPALPVTISVYINKDQIRASPRAIGAGAVELIVANRSGSSRRIVLVGPVGNRSIALATSPIAPGESATAQTIVETGIYVLRVGPGIRPIRLAIGRPRPGSQNKLLTP